MHEWPFYSNLEFHFTGWLVYVSNLWRIQGYFIGFGRTPPPPSYSWINKELTLLSTRYNFKPLYVAVTSIEGNIEHRYIATPGWNQTAWERDHDLVYLRVRMYCVEWAKFEQETEAHGGPGSILQSFYIWNLQCKARRCHESPSWYWKIKGEKHFRALRRLIVSTHLCALPSAAALHIKEPPF